MADECPNKRKRALDDDFIVKHKGCYCHSCNLHCSIHQCIERFGEARVELLLLALLLKRRAVVGSFLCIRRLFLTFRRSSTLFECLVELAHALGTLYSRAF
jgi:hypothetical protein